MDGTFTSFPSAGPRLTQVLLRGGRLSLEEEEGFASPAPHLLLLAPLAGKDVQVGFEAVRSQGLCQFPETQGEWVGCQSTFIGCAGLGGACYANELAAGLLFGVGTPGCGCPDGRKLTQEPQKSASHTQGSGLAGEYKVWPHYVSGAGFFHPEPQVSSPCPFLLFPRILVTMMGWGRRWWMIFNLLIMLYP